MKTYMNKILPIACLATCLFSSLSAEMHDADSNKKTHHPVPPATNPTAGEDSLTFFIGADYTYFVPYQRGLLIAQSLGATGKEGSLVYPTMDGRSGFKVGIGANTHFDSWVINANYTWFYNEPSMHTDTFEAALNYATNWVDASSPATPVTKVSSQFNNQFNRIDLTVDRGFFAGHYLSFRPWMGLLGAWDTQRLNFDLEYSPVVAEAESFRNKQTWWGIGPYGGCDSTYYFTNEWGLFLSSGVSLLLADHSVRQQQFETPNGDLVNQVNTNVYNVEPMFEVSLGLRWDSFWTDWALRFQVGWELQTYFSHNAMVPNYYNLGNMGDYSMQGLTVGMRANF